MNMQLFCVPYAGGSATNYLKWKPHIKEGTEIVLLELAGRGYKINQPFYLSMEDALQDVFNDFNKFYKGERYALYGHSLGCWIIYELYYFIKNKGLKLPEIIYFSGRYPPFIEKKEKYTSDMSENDFIDMVKEFGGTSNEIFDNTEFCNLYMNILRKDFTLLNSFIPRIYEEPIESNVIILTGTDDKTITNSELLSWRKLTQAGFTICKVEGDHFFLFNNLCGTVEIINEML